MNIEVLWPLRPAEIGVLALAFPYEEITQALRIGIAFLSLLLLGLSISAYRRTRITGLLYASVAFGMFAVLMLVDFLEDTVGGPFVPPYSDILSSGITLMILVLFFMAIVRRKRAGDGGTSPITPEDARRE